MTELSIDLNEIEAVSARLDLRTPNREALESIVFELAQHYEVEGKHDTFEAVVDSATGVGKTYILASAMEYLAGTAGVRNFAVIAPGRTILDKTVANFTAGHPKSLLGPMEVDPVVVTADNFNTAAMRAEMDDDSKTKLFVFTVQALTKPKTKVGKKTHKFQEGLGEAFYDHLTGLDDLVVFADEHHTYYGKAFSSAVRDLAPYGLVGLTATPHSKTPEEQVIYRYPLAAAVADRYVKTPVIVGRKDDLTDDQTKLRDGLNLLKVKGEVAARYSNENDLPQVNPVMLVVAQTIEEAEEYGTILRSSEIDGGRWADTVLVVHSKQADDALEALANVEDLESPVRIIISVGMLKEGWDVKSVFVIASMRASVSAILTEQTLGRGLRLPWGAYTDIEILDTLEVVAHERYEDLLKRAGVLNESFIDRRTRALLRENANGELVSVRETTEVSAPPSIHRKTGPDAPVVADHGAPLVEDVKTRADDASAASKRLKQEIAARTDLPTLVAPVLKTTKLTSGFSLTHIVDLEPFRKLGTRLASDPEEELRRMKVSARVVEGADGLRRTELVTSTAVDRVEAAASMLPLEDARRSLRDAILASPAVPARKHERNAVEPILDAFVEGLGAKAESVLSSYLDRASARLVDLVMQEQRKCAPAPTHEEVVEVVEFNRPRMTDKAVSKDRVSKFSRSTAYNGWKKSLYPLNWFDSKPERDVANTLDESDDVECWLRLLRNDLPILWRSDGRQYNADLIVRDSDGKQWIVEVKSDKDVESDDVQAKRKAAIQWSNRVSADDGVEGEWQYLLVSETDIEQSKGSWSALRALGT